MRRPKLSLFVTALAALAVLGAGTPPPGSGPGRAEELAYVPGEVIVKFKSMAQPLDRAATRAGFNATELVEFDSAAQHWRLGPGVDVETAVRRLRASPFVEYAEPNYIWTLDLISSDPRLDELWGMINSGQTGGTADADIDAELAWNVSTGSHDVIVGVIDTGVDYDHPELAANMWTNPGEIAGNGIDDDGNGYVDDVRGWDWVNDDNDPFDDHSHGTHCAGTIGAIGDNGIGVAGVNWQVTIMPLKFLDAAGSGYTTDAVRAVQYATMMGADLTSNSWGGASFSQALYDAIQAAGAAESAFIAAAGNDYADNDATPHYPSSYDLASIISVAATDHNDAKADFSNWGLTSVDLGAPGAEILSTVPGGSYGLKSGTSMAAPHVAGVAALIRAVSPTVPVSQMKNIIMGSADGVPSMDGITVSGGRLNAFLAIAEPDEVPPDPIVDFAAGLPTSNGMGLTWTATGDDGSTGTASYYEVRYSTAPIDDTNWEMAALAPNPPAPAPSGSPESMEAAGLDPDTAYYLAIKAFDEWASPSPLSNLAIGATLPAPTGDLAPTSIAEALFTGGTADHVVTLSNVGLGTLDFTIPTPLLTDIGSGAMPQWLSAAPTSGRLWAGESMPIDVHIDAANLEGGVYPGQVQILTNDPVYPVLTVEMTLDVTGAPDIVAVPGSLTFPTTLVGAASALPLTLLNIGTEILHISGVSVSGDFTQSGLAPPVDLPPGGSVPLTVEFMPGTDGTRSGSIDIVSDDPYEPLVTIAVAGPALQPPIAVWSPASFTEDLMVGDLVTRSLRVENQGASDLDFATSLFNLGSGAVTVYPEIVLGEDEENLRPGILGSGGPDAFGYRWSDSDEPGGPVFEWVEISEVGTRVPFRSSTFGQTLGPFPIGFDFPFYGNPFGEMYISTNGWVSFTSSVLDVGNDPLPSEGAPENMLAVLWDLLVHDTVYGSAVHYHHDGTRTIVQYSSLFDFSYTTPPFFTFQIILYPGGDIVYQYLTLDPDAPWNSHTIGIQNATRDDGLTVVFNDETYVHENLAIRFQPLNWLAVSPMSGTLSAGGALDLDVTIDATELLGGNYAASIDLRTNDPVNPRIEVPINLHVTGIPDIVADPASLTFPSTFVGHSSSLPLSILNVGSDVLQISGASVGGDFAHSGLVPPVDLPPGGEIALTVDFLPTTDGPSQGTLVITSDDPVEPLLEIALAGPALFPPVAVWSPESFADNLMVGDVLTRTLRLENQGGNDLHFVAAPRHVASGPVAVYQEVVLGEDEEDARPGIRGSGGPDVFGYRWSDSDEPGGPVFEWIDISEVGTRVPFPSFTFGQTLGPFPIGFDFPFYGNTFNEMYISTSGWVSFTSGVYDASNDPLPSAGAPENMLAALWDHLNYNASYGSAVYYQYDGTRTIIQFTSLLNFRYTSPPFFTFQIILHPDGEIVYQYLTLNPDTPWDSHTIGLQNATLDDGLTVVFNDDTYIHEELAIRFEPLNWLAVSPVSGALPAGEALDLDVTIDTTGLLGGDYSASIDLATNDPVNPRIEVPTNLHVTGIPDIAANPSMLTFPATYVGFRSSLPLSIRNVGSDELRISAVKVSGHFVHSELTVPLIIPPRSGVALVVEFVPRADGRRPGSIDIFSDDPDEPRFEIALEGPAFFPPEIGSTPEEIVTALPPGGSRTKRLTLINTGGSDLSWSATVPREASVVGSVEESESLDPDNGEEDPRVGILGSGGPDLYGYRWSDSDEPGGPVFNWIDISTTGTPVGATGDDSISPSIALEFEFPFYGQFFDTIRVCSNGWLSFTNSSTSYDNQPLPGSGAPENLIAPFWDDLNPGGAHRIFYLSFGTHAVVQWHEILPFNANTNPHTFQVILDASGKITYQYLALGLLGGQTVGIQNATRDDGLTVAFNDAGYPRDNLAIEFRAAPEWVRLDTMEGVIPAGGIQELTVTLDAEGLEDGIHEAPIDFSSNDPYAPLYQVPVSLNVGLVDAAWTSVEPEVINLSARGNFVTAVVELPPELDPHAINLSSVYLNETVPALAAPAPEYLDRDGNGIMEVGFKFDRQAVHAILPEGEEVAVRIQGELLDEQWWRGTDTVRTTKPRVISPAAAE